jgi:hypothetical protein
LTFCAQCGARTDGAFCSNCGMQNRHHVAPATDAPVAPANVEAAYPFAVPAAPAAPSEAAARVPEGPARRALVTETRVVMLAFLVPVVTSAVVLFAQHVSGVEDVTRFPELVRQPVSNLILGILAYTAVGAVVPLVLVLLARTGQPPKTLGIALPGLRSDLWPALGIAALAYVTEVAMAIPLAPIIEHDKSLISSVPVGSVPSTT